jgi:hypothetical protein
MTGPQALAVIDRLTYTLQHMRSVSAENLGTDAITNQVLCDLTPWVHGPKCLLPALVGVQDRGFVTPSELYNFCFIAHTLEPSIALTASLISTASGDSDVLLPQPSTEWLSRPWAS